MLMNSSTGKDSMIKFSPKHLDRLTGCSACKTFLMDKLSPHHTTITNGSVYEYVGSVVEARFRKLPQGSDSDSGSEAGSGHPMKLRCNVKPHLIASNKFEDGINIIKFVIFPDMRDFERLLRRLSEDSRKTSQKPS
ncbi:hypothetical protein YC2023_017104 [Brassica napus]